MRTGMRASGRPGGSQAVGQGIIDRRPQLPQRCAGQLGDKLRVPVHDLPLDAYATGSAWQTEGRQIMCHSDASLLDLAMSAELSFLAAIISGNVPFSRSE